MFSLFPWASNTLQNRKTKTLVTWSRKIFDKKYFFSSNQKNQLKKGYFFGKIKEDSHKLDINQYLFGSVYSQPGVRLTLDAIRNPAYKVCLHDATQAEYCRQASRSPVRMR